MIKSYFSDEYQCIDNKWRQVATEDAEIDEQEFNYSPLPSILKIFNIQILESSDLRKKNVVLISKEDFQELFGEDAPKNSIPRHLQIADKIYRVMIGRGIQKGCIVISDIQKESFPPSVFSTKGPLSIAAYPFDGLDAQRHSIKTVVVSVIQNRFLSNGNEKIIIAADEIRKMIKEKLMPEFIQANLPFSLHFPWGEMKGDIWKMEPANSLQGKKISYGDLSEKTIIKLHSLSSNRVEIVDKIYSDEISHLDFEVELLPRTSSVELEYGPFYLSSDEIKDKIIKKLTGNIICKGYNFIIEDPSGWDIHIKFKRAILTQNNSMLKNEEIIGEDLVDGFVLKKSAKIRLTANQHEITLTKGPPKVPQSITFKVVDIPKDATHPLIDFHQERWLDVNELLQKLKERNKPFALNETFEVSLSSGTFVVSVSNIFSTIQKSLDQTSYLQTWSLPNSDTIEFNAEPNLEVNLVKDRHALPLRKAAFQVKALNSPANEFNISNVELKDLIDTQGPKQFVHNQSFELVTTADQRLQLKLVEVKFKGEVEFQKHYTSFAQLNEDTEMCFSAPSNEKVKVIHNVYTDEIEKLKFTLTPIRRKGVDYCARTPLDIDYEGVLAKVRYELKSYPFVMEGFSFLIPYGDGWDIEVRFKDGILKPEYKSGSLETLFANVTSKNGYSPDHDTPIEFTTDTQHIVLTSGDKTLANSIQLKVIGVLENYTKDQDSIVKGNWVNLEELKTYLISMSTAFSNKKKFVADLSSGKFIIEVDNVKGIQQEVSLPKGAHLKFAIDENTLVGLSIENRFGLQKVKSGVQEPLKNIEFIVFPEQSASDQISLKEEEIIRAIRANLNFPITKKHLLTITTETSQKLRLEVKEMEMVKNIKTEKEEILGLIGPETKIVIQGKDNTNLAISKTPKILEAKNPVEYLEELGIGGIEKQFKHIKRIFYSQSDQLSDEVARRGINPIKGILLYGPPGTGKTTLARQIGDMFGCAGERLKTVNATESFDMWFGNSEKFVRDLFAPARAAQEKLGKKAPLYVIIIDEFDAMAKTRGSSTSDATDGIVTELLGQMDGVNALKNILLIAITNRKDQIDCALLRHGRLGEHLLLDLPNEKGREKIFQIHMKHLIEEQLIDESVVIEELAKQTENYSGADIQGLIVEANYFSLERLIESGVPKEKYPDQPAGKITMADFEKALDLKMPVRRRDMDEYIRNTFYT